MKSLNSFVRKDFLEQVRSGRLLIVWVLFVLFGIMNPAIAKMTPWMLEMFSDSLAEGGIIIIGTEVTAMDSWVQFFKNLPMGLIAFVLLESSIFTKEYESGTLILSLTKGLQRYKVVLSKSFVLATLWSACYFTCFLITYAYNAYFWDNSIAQHLAFSAFCWWLFGIFVISLVVLFSTLLRTGGSVLLASGAVIFAMYLVGALPKISAYLPTLLTDGNSLIYGLKDAGSYTASLVSTVIATLVCFIVSVPMFNKKQM